MKNVIIVIAEGKSEVVYLNELNRFFREEEIDCVFYPVKAVNGQYREVRRTYNEVRRKYKKERIEILVDKDIYIREQKEVEDYKNRENDGLPYFSFSYNNFEDYLILHLPYKEAKRWSDIATLHGHNKIPLPASEYLVLLSDSAIWGRVHYKKGAMPFAIDRERLDNLIYNDRRKDIFMHSDFTDILVSVLV